MAYRGRFGVQLTLMMGCNDGGGSDGGKSVYRVVVILCQDLCGVSYRGGRLTLKRPSEKKPAYVLTRALSRGVDLRDARTFLHTDSCSGVQ